MSSEPHPSVSVALRFAETHGERFWISDRERTVVDTFRLRHLIGEGMANAALRRYLGDRPKPGRLARVRACIAVLDAACDRLAGAAGVSPPSQDSTAGRAYLGLQARVRREGRPTDELLVLYIPPLPMWIFSLDGCRTTWKRSLHSCARSWLSRSTTA